MRIRDIQPTNIDKITRMYSLPHIGNDIAMVNTLRDLPALTDARRMSLCMVIALCTDGVASVMVNEKKHVVTRNNIFVITDDSVVNEFRYSDDFDGVGFIISYQVVQEILRNISNMSELFLLVHNHPSFSINDQEREIFRRSFNELLQRISIPDNKYLHEVMLHMLLTLLYDMSNAFDRVVRSGNKEDRQSRAEMVFVSFVHMVEQHFREQRQVQWYAKEMNMSPKYLCEIVSNVSRRAPNEWIDRFVCAEIRNQLRQTNKRISQIAEEMHFPTQSFFGKYFKENVGVSPTDYRNGIEAL